MDEPADKRQRADVFLGELEEPLTLRAVFSAIVGGTIGVLAMAPVAVGIPIWLGLFTINPPIQFAALVGIGPTGLLGTILFGLGGAVVVPLFFMATATYLPPVRPDYLRGVTISLIFWPGFVIAFWPSAGGFADTLFIVLSLVSHLIYGAVLGLVVRRLTGIPEHTV